MVLMPKPQCWKFHQHLSFYFFTFQCLQKTLDLHVVDGLYCELVSGPVGTDGDGREVQLLESDPVDGAGAGVLVPVHVGRLDEEGEVGHGAAHDGDPDQSVESILSVNKVTDPVNCGLLEIVTSLNQSTRVKSCD